MNDPLPPLDKMTLLRRIRAAYADAEQLLARVPADCVAVSGVCGHWSTKDLVAHLMTWEARTLRWLDDARHGTPLTVPEPGFGWDEFDRLNAVGYERYREWDYEDVRRAFHATQAQMLTAVDRLSEAELRGEDGMTGMFRDAPVGAIAANTYEHYELHLAQIRDWLDAT